MASPKYKTMPFPKHCRDTALKIKRRAKLRSMTQAVEVSLAEKLERLNAEQQPQRAATGN